jgi:hypothetical protein
MLYDEYYDEINAELQRLAAIEQEDETNKICIASGEDATAELYCEAL